MYRVGMNTSPAVWFPCLRVALGLMLWVMAFGAQASLAAGSAQALRELHGKLGDKLAHSPLKRPIVLDSAETDGGLQGDVYVVVDHSLDDVRRALEQSSQWCEMLLLHINNRRCRVAGDTLTLSVVPRYDKPIDQAFELSFTHRTVSSGRDYLQIELAAQEGPMGTSRYRVLVEGIPLGEQQSFLHFAYSYDHNMVARLATMAYLATFGSHKVGFTVVDKKPSGDPEYIRGLRGLVERNAMRYFLALEAYLDGLPVPAGNRVDKRLRRWFEASERYPAQLHEIDLATYLDVKREDRQRDAAPTR